MKIRKERPCACGNPFYRWRYSTPVCARCDALENRWRGRETRKQVPQYQQPYAVHTQPLIPV